ncbi:hypothetical protein DFJ58DRAFT_725604 [Suillus subalutaceus]|uniref:uncharacterized protein n=1 Tax=Suillus subalutaceus TaxID=48586 RepID=UPI001B8607D8|nr:uncharacterized protein DFJ58DRAFT_725604 [Suillus subalutaceus]KAG1861761.1 hypothetical protein DFJ58DRAFT_725604 [Suillus subalutaceus]
MPMASSTQDLIPHLHLANTLGALFIGVIIAAVLFGVTIVQVFIYFQTHSGTGITFYKLVVILLWILDALHLALIVYSIYFYLVINYANISALKEIVWSCKLQFVVTVFTIFVEHLIYVYRICTVSKGRSKVLSIIVGVVVVLTSGPAIAAIWYMYQEVHVIPDLVKIEWALYVYLGTIACVDVIIALSLCYILATSRTGFSRQNGFIHNKAHDLYHQYRLFDEYVFNDSYHYMMPKNYAFKAVEFILVKRMAKEFLDDEDHADSCPTQTQRILPNAIYAMTSTARDCALERRRTMNSRHPDEMLQITRPVQAVTRPIEVTMKINSLSSA